MLKKKDLSGFYSNFLKNTSVGGKSIAIDPLQDVAKVKGIVSCLVLFFL